jgi:two-component system phosphate regulon sensor histidine kinase PhoR
MMKTNRLRLSFLLAGISVLAVIIILQILEAGTLALILASALALALVLGYLSYSVSRHLAARETAISHLAVHREELRQVLSSIGDVLWSQDYDGRIQWTNEPFQQLFPAYDPEHVQNLEDLKPSVDLLSRIRDAERNPNLPPQEIFTHGHSFVLSLSRNDHTRREVLILHNTDALQQTARIKKDFIVNLAHELRTPLTAIKGFTEAMQESPGTDHARHLKIILSHTRRLIHLIRDMEQLIRLESSSNLELQEINLATFLENIRLILEPDIHEKGLSLDITLDPTAPRLVCDPFRFEQVFINLVQNSLRYTDSGGISIRSFARGEDVVFEVADTGRGIGIEHLDKIFERFYVADSSRNKSRSGTGLGLAIVKHIVMLHQGEISVSSEKGVGTTFRITIPVNQPDISRPHGQ